MSSTPSGILLADFPKLPLPDSLTDKLVADAHDWAHAHGLVMRTKDDKSRSDICQTAPFALLPTPFPRKHFQQAVDVQNAMAELYHQISYDYEFIIDSHAKVIETDEFTRNLVNIYKKVHAEGLAQPASLALMRSDYMCHKDAFTSEYALKQVEVNLIASSMGGHADRVSKLHHRTMLELGYDKDFVDIAIPDNRAIATLVEGLFKAWKYINESAAVILVIVEDVNQNQIDQRHVEFSLEEMGVPVDQIVRKTFAECTDCLTLSPERHLLFSGSRVAVVYFRAGYVPEHYTTEKDWNVRLTIERSSAVKAPWIGMQLANTKKTQQMLAQDGVVERYVGHPRQAAAIRSVFAGLWGLESNDQITSKLVEGAIRHPSRFVLKPQLEGGAGNYYDDDVAKKLSAMTLEERSAFILMEKIEPMVVENYLIRALTNYKVASCVTELGIYGYAFGVKGTPEMKTAGHLMRTKARETNEGGVAVGAAVIDSPYLFELL